MKGRGWIRTAEGLVSPYKPAKKVRDANCHEKVAFSLYSEVICTKGLDK